MSDRPNRKPGAERMRILLFVLGLSLVALWVHRAYREPPPTPPAPPAETSKLEIARAKAAAQEEMARLEQQAWDLENRIQRAIQEDDSLDPGVVAEFYELFDYLRADVSRRVVQAQRQDLDVVEAEVEAERVRVSRLDGLAVHVESGARGPSYYVRNLRLRVAGYGQ